MRQHPIFDELDASLSVLMSKEPVEFAGNWLPSSRRTYQSARQSGTGSGPFVDVVDFKWHGTLTCSVPIAGIAFLATTDEVFWAKSVPATESLSVDVSLHAYADYLPERATFVAGIGNRFLPGIPVDCGRDLIAACELGRPDLTTARVERLAQVDVAAFVVLLMQGRFLKVGRHRLWHVREDIASSLPPRVREILTRRRSGTIRWESNGG